MGFGLEFFEFFKLNSFISFSEPRQSGGADLPNYSFLHSSLVKIIIATDKPNPSAVNPFPGSGMCYI